MFTITRKTLLNKRLLAVLALGFAAGLPLGLTSSTLQAWLTEVGVSLATIGAISLIGIPYTLKFLWAPLMDYFSFPWLGRRRGWILLMQAGLGVALLVMAQMDPTVQVRYMYSLAIAIAFLSASQDVAIDAYRTDILPPDERGLGSAYYIFTYRVAMLVSGGLALICADYIGWKLTYEIMGLLILFAMIPTYLAPLAAEVGVQTGHFFTSMTTGLFELLQRQKIMYLCLFLLLYKFGDALALQLMTNFLLHGLGFSLTEVGVAYKVMGFVATVLGAFVGGLFLTRWSIYRALIVFGLAQAFSNLLFVLLAMVGKHFTLMAISIFVEYFCSGLSTAALLAFIMSLCNHRYTASQFALLSAVTSLGRVFLGPVAAWMVANLGWVGFYSWAFVLSFPGVLLLWLLKREVLDYAFDTAH